jgi:hypothetical protein
MRRATRRLKVALLAGGLLFAQGCRTSPSAPEVRPASALDASSAFATLERLDASGAVDASDLVPGHAGTEPWRSLEGLLAPDAYDVVTDASPLGAGATATRTADLKTAHWMVTDDGSLVLERVDSHPDGAASIFTPPLLLSPASLAAGAEATAESPMRVVQISNPASERDRGTATRTVRYTRDEKVRWRGETHRAKVIEVTFVADLSTARAERFAEQWVLPGKGVIAERWRETLTILKVFTKKSDQFAYRE